MTKILILGSTGMLGHQVTKYFLQFSGYEVIDIAHKQKYREQTILLDAKNETVLNKTIISIRPQVIINCIGMLISDSKNNPADAIYLNSYLPHQLKNIAKSIQAKVIHISTDAVFSGKKGHYTESDIPDANDTYARTKILGELIDDTNITLRTSILGPQFHKNGTSLFEWFMKQNGTIHGYQDVIWTGVTTLELAKIIKLAIENDIHGLYHVSNNQSISKYDLLNLFKKHTKKKIEIIPLSGQTIDKSLINTRQEINFSIPSYDQMIKNMIDSLYS